MLTPTQSSDCKPDRAHSEITKIDNFGKIHFFPKGLETLSSTRILANSSQILLDIGFFNVKIKDDKVRFFVFLLFLYLFPFSFFM